MAQEYAVEVSAVKHKYGKINALKNVSLKIPSGITVGVVGADGVGKSTLLSLIATTKILQEGDVKVFGLSVAKRANRSELSHRVAFMPQGLGRNLYPTLSVLENIEFHARLFGISRKKRKARIERLLAATCLTPFKDRAAGKLSGGMKQKLSLCCALVHSPDLLILDEPTTGVDPLSRRQFWELLASLRKESPSMTVMVSTAYIDEAENFEHTIVMNDGEILADENTKELIKQNNASTLEEAYLRILPPEKRGNVEGFHIPPFTALPDTPASIKAQGLTKKFGNFTAVNNVSFTIQKGEIFGFLGSNGCGKSTTMKMLTGLLEPSEGTAEILGQSVEAGGIEVRKKVGYMSQAFSLYEELSVEENLLLHARLYNLPQDQHAKLIEESLERFNLKEVRSAHPASLSLGVKQRLQLAAACLHSPEILILDEPTSGVDPGARDMFWDYLIKLSREDRVTIFVSTHFMNEAERCDRISLMHRGRVLAVGTPNELRESQHQKTLEEAFIKYLEAESDSVEKIPEPTAQDNEGSDPNKHKTGIFYALSIIFTFAFRESRELIRDPIRFCFAVFGAIIFEFAASYGISFDMTPMKFAVLDHDQTLESRGLIKEFQGSAYFEEGQGIDTDEPVISIIQKHRTKLIIDIPDGYGRDLVSGKQPEISFYIDGGFPMMADNVKSYVAGILKNYSQRILLKAGYIPNTSAEVKPIVRFRYNESFESRLTMVPGIIMLCMILFPTMMTALGVVREKELGTISNLYTSPATVLEFLIGKQLSYMLVSFISFASLMFVSTVIIGVPITGSVIALLIGVLLVVMVSTAFGLLISSFVKSQIAAIFGSAILTVVPAINFSGFLYPVSTLQGSAYVIGKIFPCSWFEVISLGTITKGLGIESFQVMYGTLFLFFVVYMSAACVFLKKQEK